MSKISQSQKIIDDLLGYMMKHRPVRDPELSRGFHDLNDVFPGIYDGHARDYRTYSDNPRVDIEAMKAITAAQGNPDAMIPIYRAVPKGIRDINTGDWVSTSKAYAKGHGESALGGDYDLLTTKARAADLSEPGDSIAEQGYWGEPTQGKLTRGLLALIAGGGATAAALGSPNEADAAVSKHFALPFINAWHNGVEGSMHAGTFEPEIFSLIQKKYPSAKNNVYATLHTGDSRVQKDGWSAERTAESIGDILNSKKGNVIENWQIKPRKGAYADNGVLLPYDIDPLFAPFILDKGGNITLKTAFSPSTTKLNNLGYGAEGGKTLISRSSDALTSSSLTGSNEHLSKAGSQPLPISVVAPQPNMQSTLADFWPTVKKIGLIGSIGTGAALADPSDAKASIRQPQLGKNVSPFAADRPGYVNHEQGLEAPIWDPVDLATAPIGVAGYGGKALAMAADPFITYGMDKAMGPVAAGLGKASRGGKRHGTFLRHCQTSALGAYWVC